MFAGVSSALSKSEMVAPQWTTQKVFVGTPRHPSGAQASVSSHVPQVELEQRRAGKEEDSAATYTADTLFDFAKDEEKTDEMEPKMPRNNMIQNRVNFFENCFKTVCFYYSTCTCTCIYARSSCSAR
jgi:hypothetical protein